MRVPVHSGQSTVGRSAAQCLVRMVPTRWAHSHPRQRRSLPHVGIGALLANAVAVMGVAATPDMEPQGGHPPDPDVKIRRAEAIVAFSPPADCPASAMRADASPRTSGECA